MAKRRVCFVTGTRAEFGLMEGVLRAVEAERRLELSIVATGMHLDRRHGRTIDDVRRRGWRVDGVVPWRGELASATGLAVAGINKELDRLGAEVVLVVGDRVEAMAGAVAGHLSGRIVAHVHGGDRALGQVDDSLRHAITKLAHVHFPATRQSAERIIKLGEDRWRVHCVGSPGVDGIRELAVSRGEVEREFGVTARRFVLLVLHPADADDRNEEVRARGVLDAVIAAGVDRAVIVYPNNDPGSAGIMKVWEEVERAGIEMLAVRRDVPRGSFLGLMREAAVLVGNSSSGIIEAASFGTPVVDIGPRQQGRERSGNVVQVDYDPRAIERAVSRVWNAGRPAKWRGANVYGGGSASVRIARVLATLDSPERFRRKLIAY